MPKHLNLLTVMFDSLRPDHIATNGHPQIRTPNLDHFAAEGTVFARTYAEYPITIPSRTAFFCGIYTFTNRSWSTLRPYDTTLAEVLRREGYRTACFADSPMGTTVWDFDRGFDEFTYVADGPCHTPVVEGREPDFGPYSVVRAENDDRASAQRFLSQTRINRQWSMETRGYYSPDTITHLATEWLDNADTDKPFWLHLDYFDPHEPWDPPEPYMSMYDPGYTGKRYAMPTGPEIDWMTPEELQQVRHLYMGKVTQVDDQLPALWKALREKGLAENTLVVIISDHGEPFGEHRRIRKFGVPLYDELAACVMMMRLPGVVPEGKRVETLAQNVDMMPTLLDLFGVDDKPRMDGVSLVPIIQGKADTVREEAHIGAFQLRAGLVTDDGWKLIDNRGEKPDELYRLPDDPQESRNLHADKADLARSLHRRLWEFAARWHSPLSWRTGTDWQRDRPDGKPPPQRAR